MSGTPDPFDELFGEPATEPARVNRGGRPNREQARAKLDSQIASATQLASAAAGHGLDDLGGINALLRPVTKSTLAAVFRMDKQTVAKRLARCPSKGHGNRQLYDFVDGASYLIRPKMTPQEFIRTLNTADLPPQINMVFWESQRRRIKFKIEAQEAWETGDVLEVLGDVFMTIKDTLQMATEEMRERARLSDEQAAMFDSYIDELRESLRAKLVAMPAEKQTPSLLDQPLFGTAGRVDAEEDLDLWDVGDEGDGE